MIEQLLSKENLNKAFLKVYDNEGSGGVDGIEVEHLYALLEQKGSHYANQIRKGSYEVSAILGVEIEKLTGGIRLLGIPTVLDRTFQQALCQILEPLFEPEFQEHSYGFRPNRSAHQAVKQSQLNINEGYTYIVDIDLASFFDEVEHYILLGLIYKKVKCRKVLKLLRSFLRAPLQHEGKLYKRRKGTPQGSPISPLLSNIILNELDKELEKRGHRYVRYADDFSIYVKSEQAAKRVGNSIYKFLRDVLKLPINRQKSGIRRPVNFDILGFTYVSNYSKKRGGRYLLVVSKKRWQVFQQKLKRLTRKTTAASFSERVYRLNNLIRGWLNYFKIAHIQGKLKKLDGWLRNRLRYCIWHDWKKPERRRKNLIRLGVRASWAYAWSRSRKGGWAIAQSPILQTTITIKRMEKRGYLRMLNYYHKVKHH